MSKKIKQMEMAALRTTFQDVRDLVVLTVSGVDSQTDNQMRLSLRKKNIRLQVVKNSLTRRVFDEMGMKVSKYWEGPTLLAWGAGSLSELSRELDALARKNKNLKFKGAVSEGLEIGFDQALKMPTKAEALGRIVSLVQSPITRVLSQVQAPASRIMGQLKTLAEKAPGEGGAPADAAAAPAAG
jgi:large subunit ribosomal protein L10